MATPDREDDLKEIKKSIKQLQEGQGGGERPGFLRALKDYVLDVKDTPRASISKADEKESKGGALSEKDSKNLADIAKTNRVIAKALVESAREVRREKRRGVEPRIPSASTGATVTPAATATGGKQVAALLREPVAQQPQTEGAPGTPGPILPVPDIDLPDRRTPPGAPKPSGKPSILQRGVQLGKELLTRTAPAAPVVSAAAIAAAPFVATRQQIEKIKADPNAPGLEFNPLAQTIRGEAKTVGQAGRQNRDRAVGQVKWGEVKAFVESDMTDQELYEQLGRNRKELKEWLEQNKDGKTPYDKFTVAPAVASRAAESMIPWETPAVQPTPEVGAPPPITGMESAFVPTPPAPASTSELEVGPTREMFEADQAQQARNVVMRRRKRPERADASARQQAEIEAGNLVEQTPQVQPVKPKEEETGPVSGTEAAIMRAEGLDPEDDFDRKLYRRRRDIQRRRGGVQPTPSGVEQKPQLTQPEIEPVAQPQQPAPVRPAKTKEDETGPVSAAESFLMQQKGLDPNNEFDRKLYRRMDRTENRREQQRMGSLGYAPVDERGRVVGAELNTMSVQNNDLQRQGNAPSSQPIVIQNNSAPSTQTTVTPPAQPRVDSSFSRVMDIRNFWD